MTESPHAMLEGIAIAAWAVRAKECFIYIRGEYTVPIARVRAAIAEAEAAGYLGENVLGSGFGFKTILMEGAGAYICGEETGRRPLLEGKKGDPNLKAPFPAALG